MSMALRVIPDQQLQGVLLMEISECKGAAIRCGSRPIIYQEGFHMVLQISESLSTRNDKQGAPVSGEQEQW